MLKPIFTLDYEIQGNGEGCPYELMIEPTDRLLRLFDQYGAKATIMADIGEILCFKEYAARHADDKFHYAKIEAQLQDAVRRGHDVQLHIHSSYFNSKFDGLRWVQDWSEYNFAGLNLERMRMMVKKGVEYLESILKPIKPDYRCTVFRAANWSVSPAGNLVKVLLENGIKIDTSIFKYGRRNGIVKFDYSHAENEGAPWPASDEDLCVKDGRGRLWEFPIYCENRPAAVFLTVNRMYRVAQECRYRSANGPSAPPPDPMDTDNWTSVSSKLLHLTQRHAWKADFNQCTGKQLIGALERAEEHYANGSEEDAPFVLIGHSKTFTRWNEMSIKAFLAHVARHGDRFKFGTFEPFVDKIKAIQMSGKIASRAEVGVDEREPDVIGSPMPVAAFSQRVLGMQLATAMKMAKYAIITPAHNEEALLAETIEAILNQTVKPVRWVIVDDRSTDRTREIAESYARKHDFIRVLSLPESRERNFGRKALAFNQGVLELVGTEYDFIGNIDADMTFPPEYFQRVLEEFAADSKLGLSGGTVCTMHAGRFVSQDKTLGSVGGALQLFRKECFEAIGGGYLPLEYGGIDTAAEIFSRMKGWTVRKIPTNVAYESRSTGTADRGVLRASFRRGERFHSLGYGMGFHFCRCLYRLTDRPIFLGSLYEFSGYVSSSLQGRPIVLPPEVIRFWRNERWEKLFRAPVLRWPVVQTMMGRKPAHRNSSGRTGDFAVIPAINSGLQTENSDKKHGNAEITSRP